MSNNIYNYQKQRGYALFTEKKDLKSKNSFVMSAQLKEFDYLTLYGGQQMKITSGRENIERKRDIFNPKKTRKR